MTHGRGGRRGEIFVLSYFLTFWVSGREMDVVLLLDVVGFLVLEVNVQ